MGEVRLVSNRLIVIVLVFEDVLWLTCGYSPQSDRNLEEKECLVVI